MSTKKIQIIGSLLEVDSTLTQSGKAADSKAVGDAVSQKSQVQMIVSDGAEILPTLKIHKLTNEEYDKALANGTVDENALYLTPDEEIDLSGYVTKDELAYMDSAVAQKTQVQIITWEADD